MPPQRRPYLEALDSQGSGYGSPLSDPYGEFSPEDAAYLQSLEPQGDFAPQEYQGKSDLFAGLENVPMGRPTSLGTGLAAGLLQGLGSAGTRAEKAKAQFQESEAQRRKEFDTERREASRFYRSESGRVRRERGKESLDRKKAREKYEQDNVIPTPDQLKAAPYIDRLPKDAEGRVSRSAVESAIGKTEDPMKVAREQRQIDAAERQARAAERQERLASAQTTNQIADDYPKDPDIAAYRTATQNLSTIRAAEKLGTGPGDLAMLIAYQRATEPGVLSVVRQEELANASKSVGGMARYLNLPKEFITGQRLNAAGRKQLREGAEAIAQSREPAFREADEQFRRRAESFGADPSLFRRSYSTADPGSAQSRVSATTPKPGGFFDRNRPRGR